MLRLARRVVLFLALGLGLVLSTSGAVAAPGDVGYRDQSYVGASSSPAGTKPESKLWWNDGFWWASTREASNFRPELQVTAADTMIAAAGDIACDPTSSSFKEGLGTASSCRQRHTSDLLVDAGLSAVVPLGDLQYECGAPDDFSRSYDPSWGRVKAITRPAIGNHEYKTSGGMQCDPSGNAGGYFGYFGPSAGDPRKGYYSYDLGTWHLIALNSNCSEIGGCDPGSPQELWLRQDLAASTALCTLAYWHHPLFSSGVYAPGIGAVRPLFQALYEQGADVVLSAHDHNYERFAPQNASGAADATYGIRQFIVGTGGRSHYPQGTPIGNSEVRESGTFGVLMLTLRADGYEWKFVPEAGEKFTDSGSGSCHDRRPEARGPIAFKAISSAANRTATKLVIRAPRGVAAGNVLLASIDVRGNPTITAPRGWTLVRMDVITNAFRKATYYRVAKASEPPSYTWTFSSAQAAAGGILAYSGVSTTDPVDRHSGRRSTGRALIVAPSVTTTVANAMVVGLFGVTGSVTVTPPRGMRERWDLASTSGKYKISSEAADVVQAQASATAGKIAQADVGTNPGIGQIIALRPARP